MFAVSGSTLSIAGIASDLGCDHTTPQRADLAKRDWTIKADQPLPTTNRSEMGLNAKTIDSPVADGTLPLVYLVGSDGVVTVRNITFNQLLATAPVSHNSTVAVDARRGVLVDGKSFAAGPLAAEDRYGIFYSVAGVTNEIITAKQTNDPDLLRWHYSGKTPPTSPPTSPPGSPQAATRSTTHSAPGAAGP